MKLKNIFNLWGCCLHASEDFSAYIKEHIGSGVPASYSLPMRQITLYIIKWVDKKGQHRRGFGGMEYTNVCNPIANVDELD